MCPFGKGGRAWRSVRSLVGAGAEHQLLRENRTLRGAEEEATRRMARDRANVDAGGTFGVAAGEHNALVVTSIEVPGFWDAAIAAWARIPAAQPAG